MTYQLVAPVFFCDVVGDDFFAAVTCHPSKIDMTPEKGSFQKDISSSNHQISVAMLEFFQ